MSINEVTIPRLMTVREVAEALRCSKPHTYRLIYAGEIPTAKVAGKTVCRAIDVEAYITRCLEASGLGESGAANTRPSDTLTESGSVALSEQRRSKRLMLS